MKSERYLVAGSGISGIAAAKLLVKAGKKVQFMTEMTN